LAVGKITNRLVGQVTPGRWFVEIADPVSTSRVREFPGLLEAPVKYLILIHSNPASRALWEKLSDTQRMEFGRSHFALSEALAESGELVVSEGLADPELAKRVSVREGQTLTTDGPFAEVKEYLAGFLLVECENMEEAVAIAARVPDAATGAVEVRPVFDMSLLDP
jgi:hypothetical protein